MSRDVDAECGRLRTLQAWVAQVMSHASLQGVAVAATRGLRAALGIDTVRLFVFDPVQGDLVTWSLPDGGEDTPGGMMAEAPAAGVGVLRGNASGIAHDGVGAGALDDDGAGDGLTTLAVLPPANVTRVPTSRGLLGEAFRTARPLQSTHSSTMQVGRTEAELGSSDRQRTVLCEPVVDSSGVVVGVAEVRV